MAKKEKRVPLREAAEQVRITGVRLALMHLAFSKVLVEELGEKKGKETIVKAMMEYGRRVEKGTKRATRTFPLRIPRHVLLRRTGMCRHKRKNGVFRKGFQLFRYRVHGCILAKTFREYGNRNWDAFTATWMPQRAWLRSG